MEELKGLLANQYVISALWLVAGSVVTLIFYKIRNKTGVFGYISNSNRVALSADDSIFGSVRATWQGHQVRNLHFFAIEVENLTSTDYENVEFKVYSANDTLILNERTEVIETPYIIPWSDSYQKKMAADRGQQATAQQTEEHSHNREYLLPVFNRSQKLRFSYLCTKPNDDQEPGVFISTPAKGVRLKALKNPYVILNPIWGVPIPAAIVRALIIAVLVVILCGLFVENVWLASAVSMFVGLTGQFFGAALYKVEKIVKKLIAG